MIDAGPKWTQDEAVAFECAHETITDLMAIRTSEIADEAAKPMPDAARIAGLRAERSRLARERAGLHWDNHFEIARIRADYGAYIRAWREAERCR
ncbi:MAG: hypothetical protein PHR30_11505 [Gallionellaceae bacterium]|nr:hypothetical protein [Gallionellaceae bacterium]